MENNEKKNLNEQEMEQISGGVRLAKLAGVQAGMDKYELIVDPLPKAVNMTVSEHDDGPEA